MKVKAKIFLGLIIGAIGGCLLPYGIAFLNILPFLNGETNYEVVMAYMFYSGAAGAIVGGLWTFQRSRKISTPK